MNQRLLMAGAFVLIAGLSGLLWYSRSGPTTSGDRGPEGIDQGDPRKRGDTNPFRTSRPATDKDVPPDKAAALARPETPRNKAMATIRSDFAAGRYTAVVQATKAILDSDPDLESARVFLTMSACALGDEDAARRELAELSAARQEFVTGRCVKFGLDLRQLR